MQTPGLHAARLFEADPLQGGALMQMAEGSPRRSIFERLLRREKGSRVPPSPSVTSAGPNGVVVVVEDDPTVRGLLTRIAESSGYAVFSASSFEEFEALEIQKTSASVVLDLTLKGSDAFDVLRFLAQNGFTGPIMIVSGHPQPLIEYVANFGRQQGLSMTGSLKKPFKVDQFRSLLNSQHESTARPVKIDFAEVLRLDQLEVFYQPRVRLVDHIVAGFEALVRIRHPTEGLLLPARFINELNDSEMAGLTARVVAKTLEAWTALAASGHFLKPSINVRARELVSPALLDLLRSKKPTDHRWSGLVMELTEPKLIDEVEAARESVVRLQLHGVQLAIDDFGEVVSRRVKSPEIQLSEINISRRFVAGCASKPDQLAVCEAAVTYARRYKLRTVAEGIENPSDLAALKRLGFDLGQGNLLSAPMPFASLLALLNKREPLLTSIRAGTSAN